MAKLSCSFEFNAEIHASLIDMLTLETFLQILKKFDFFFMNLFWFVFIIYNINVLKYVGVILVK